MGVRVEHCLVVLLCSVAACDGRALIASDPQPIQYPGPCTETVYNKDQTTAWVTTFQYDSKQRMIHSEYGDDLVGCYTHTYDDHDNPVAVVDCGPPEKETPGGGQYRYVYDAMGRVSTSTFTPAAYWHPTTVDSYDYDDAGRRIHRRTRSGQEAEQLVTYAYDDHGQLITETWPEHRIHYDYDERGHLVGQRSEDFHFPEVVYAHVYTTDEAGNRLTASGSGPSGPLWLRSSYTYDCWTDLD